MQIIKSSLTLKNTLIISSFLIVLTVSYTLINIRSQENILRKRLEDEAATLLTIMEASVAEALNDYRIDQVRQHLQFIKKNDEIIYAYVYGKKGHILSDGTFLNQHRHQEPLDTLGRNSIISNKPLVQFTDDILSVSMPVYLSINRIGTVQIGYSLELMHQEIAAIRDRNIIFGLIFLLFGITLTFFLIRRIVNPIKELKAATQNVAEGDFSKKISVKTGDELESLSASFNIMIDRILETRTGIINAKEEAEKSNRLKSEFLAQMSHEIRTPVNTILSFASLIRSEVSDDSNDDIEESFDIIERGGQRLIRTIDLILNMSELQAGTYKCNMESLNLQEDVLEPLISELKVKAASKELDFYYYPTHENSFVFGDRYTLMQLFANLIDNAIKYTNDGKVAVVAEGVNGVVSVSVIDTGIGISEKYLNLLFEPFSQEEQGYTRKFEGNGLGLALVKKYCELNHAQIDVESKKGKGSNFKVTFQRHILS